MTTATLTNETEVPEAMPDETVMGAMTEEESVRRRTRYQSPANRLLRAQVAIENAMNDADIQAALETYAYTRERLQQGMTLYTETRRQVELQTALYGEQYGTTDKIDGDWERAREMYRSTLGIARIVFKDNKTAQAGLRLNGNRKRSFGAWATQALTFYNNLTERADWIAEMGRFGYIEEKIQQERDTIDALLQTNARQEMTKGQAQTMTQTRNAKLRELDEWVATFKKVAKIALRNNKQWLEKLGFGAV